MSAPAPLPPKAQVIQEFGVEVNATFTTQAERVDAAPGSFLAQLIDGPLVMVKPLT